MSLGRYALLALSLLVAAACQSSGLESVGPSAPTGQILIASDLPTSGLFGDGFRAQLAIKLAFARHPTVGRFKLSYWSLDDAVAGQAWPEKGIQNVQMMLDDPRVLAMIGPANSYLGVEEIPVANAGDFAMVSPSNTNFCLTITGPYCAAPAESLRPNHINNYFRLSPPDPVQGTAMARYITRVLGVKRVAIINEWDTDGLDIIRYFDKELESNGGQVILSSDFDPGTTDFRAFLSEANDKSVQAVYALGDDLDKICLVRAQMPADAVFLGTDGFTGTQDCLSQAGAGSGSILATKPDVDISHSQDAAATSFVQAYNRAYPGIPITQYVAAAYDCAQILIAAIERAIDRNAGNIPSRPQVLDEVANDQFQGLTGTYSFDQNGDARAPLMSMYQVTNGKWTYDGKIDATATP